MNMVASWNCTEADRLLEPVLVLRTTEGQELSFMLPGAAAEKMGRALIAQAERAASLGRAN